MKKSHIKLSLMALFVCVLSFAQTPEQKKQIEKAERMCDSILNLPAYKKAMEQVKAAQSMMPKSIMQKSQTKEKKRNQAEVNKKSAKEADNEFYWRNTIASNTKGKFTNWLFGNAEIRTSYRNREMKNIELKIGTISNDGRVTFNLTEINRLTIRPMSENQHESEEIVNNKYLDLNHSNINVGYFSTRHGLSVYSGNKRLGALRIGNSVKPVINLNSPCCIGNAGSGYMAYWVYMTQGNTITGKRKIRENQPAYSGEIVHDLHFKKGWNLIKMEVNGNRGAAGTTETGGATRYWRNKYVTATTTLPSDAKFYLSSPQIKN